MTILRYALAVASAGCVSFGLNNSIRIAEPGGWRLGEISASRIVSYLSLLPIARAATALPSITRSPRQTVPLWSSPAVTEDPSFLLLGSIRRPSLFRGSFARKRGFLGALKHVNEIYSDAGNMHMAGLVFTHRPPEA